MSGYVLACHLLLRQLAYCSSANLVRAGRIANLAAAKWRAPTSLAPCTAHDQDN